MKGTSSYVFHVKLLRAFKATSNEKVAENRRGLGFVIMS